MSYSILIAAWLIVGMLAGHFCFGPLLIYWLERRRRR